MRPEEDDTETKVVDALEEVPDNCIRLSSGVVLRGKQAPPLALVRVMAAFPRPKPPVYRNETLGRDVENPDDPDYIDRLRSHQTESTNAMMNALILLGTELVDVPAGFPKPSDDTWLDRYQEMGLTPKPQSENWRYLTWVTFVAVLNEKDLDKIQKVVGRLSGVPENAVKSAEDFPGSHTNGRKPDASRK